MAGGKSNKAAREQKKQQSYDRGVMVERWAARLMRLGGFDILCERYKAKGGEIDLICRKEDMVVFLEVKYRSSLEDALYAITPRNQARIVAAASTYLAQFPDETISTYRFDAMVFAKGRGAVPLWRHIEAAFEAY